MIEEEVYLPRHRFVKARGHPPQTLQKYRIAFATSHDRTELFHFRDCNFTNEHTIFLNPSATHRMYNVNDKKDTWRETVLYF